MTNPALPRRTIPRRTIPRRTIPLAALRFFVVLLAALALTMESAHVLELPQKAAYGARMYAAVNTTLYRYFAIVGGSYQVTSIVLAGALVMLLRRRGSTVRWTAAGFGFGLAAFVVWLVVVQPVNADVGETLRQGADPAAAWSRTLRQRWEFGHVAGFVLQVCGLSALIVSLLIDEERSGTTNGS
jgi:hypothetical protein